MYEIHMRRQAQRALNRLGRKDAEAVMERLDVLKNTPRPKGVDKIKSTEGMWRVRQGDYRIVYSIDDNQKIITVLDIDHRKQVYRWL